MLDISQAWKELPDIQRVTIISVKNEVKELLLYWKKRIGLQAAICRSGGVGK